MHVGDCGNRGSTVVVNEKFLTADIIVKTLSGCWTSTQVRRHSKFSLTFCVVLYFHSPSENQNNYLE